MPSGFLSQWLVTLTTASYASPCPPPDPDGNIHIAEGEYCSGGIAVDSSGVNDISIEGHVNGNVTNLDIPDAPGMDDFLINSGVLEGSFVNNGMAGSAHVTNGSEVFANIENNGSMDSISVDAGPEGGSIIHGAINNTGEAGFIGVSGEGTRVDQGILNTGYVDSIEVVDGALVSQIVNQREAEFLGVGSASVENNILNDTGGSVEFLWVKDSVVGGSVTNNGNCSKSAGSSHCLTA